MTWRTLGFETNKLFFERAIESGYLSHAYLFSGQDMIGKRTFALELADVINGHDAQVAYNQDCLLISSDISKNQATIAIEDIRKAKNYLSLSIASGHYKLVIIDNAEQMTMEAQNAFLKVLEEASDSSIIILVSAFPENLLPTIISRCQEIAFPSHSVAEITQFLAREQVSSEKAEFLAKFVNGRLGLALSIARDNSFDQLKSYIAELAALKKQSLNSRFKLAQTLAEEEQLPELKNKILYWMLYLRMQSVENHGTFLRQLNELNFHLGQPQFNRRLMLEDFMLRL